VRQQGSAEWRDQLVDPDVDLHVDEQRREWARPWVLPAASVGGAVGALLRYGVEQALPYRAGGWPTATMLTNVSGCLLIGLLMAVLLRTERHRSVWRILLGVGVLGGYTTFSTYAVQASSLIDTGEWVVSVGYMLATVVAACTAALLGLLIGRAVADVVGKDRR
jgi:CrcB protein